MVRLKYAIVAFMVLLLFIQVRAYAMPVDGPEMPEYREWLWGSQANFIFKRRVTGVEGRGDSRQYFITGSYGLFDFMSLDGKNGAGDVRFGGEEGISGGTTFRF